MNIDWDVMVVGGGPAGIGAAIAAGRMGLRVGLIERHPILGGMGTAALVNNFCPGHFDGKRFIIGGVFGELRQRLVARKALYDGPDCYNPNVFSEEVATLCANAGVKLFLEETVKSVDAPGNRIVTLHLQNQALTAQTIVDATGDATIAAQTGVPFTFGRPSDHAVMPLTYCYEMGPVDLDEARRQTPELVRYDDVVGEHYFFVSGPHPGIDAKLKAARTRGELSIARDHISMIASVPGRPQFATVNFGRVTIADPTDPVQLAAADQRGHLQVAEGIQFFRRYLPGFARVELVRLARQIGVRETRQIVGLYTLTGADVMGCRQFNDVIAQCRYPIDIHEPGKDSTIYTPLPPGEHYDIPWRCLVPRQGPANLIVGGRSISATQEAMGSFRVSPPVMAIGEAAGVTAALAAQRNCPICMVPVGDVQHRLIETGGILK